MTIIDNRTCERFATAIQAQGMASDGIPFSVQIVNFTPTGLALTSLRTMRVGRIFELELKLVTGDKMYFECEIMWSQPIDFKGLTSMGVKASRIREVKYRSAAV